MANFGESKAKRDLKIQELLTNYLKASKDERKEIKSELEQIQAELGITRKLTKDSMDDWRENIAHFTTATKLAETVSRSLGEEAGVKRVMETKLAEMVNKSEDIRTALMKGDSDVVRGQMVSGLVEQLKQTGQFSNELLEELREDFKSTFDWDKIQDRGNSIFFPLTQKFWRGVEDLRSTIVTEVPALRRFFSKEMVEHYRQGFNEFTNVLKGEMSTILSPIDALVGPFMGIFKGFMVLGRTLFTQSTTYEEETANWTQKTYQALVTQNEMLSDEQKQRLLKKDEKDGIFSKLGKGIGTILGALGFVLGAAIGAVVGQAMIPFKVLLSGLKTIARPFMGLVSLFSKIPGMTTLAKGGGKIVDGVKKVVTFFGSEGPIFKFLSKIPMLGKAVTGLFSGLQFGIKILGWPLQIVMTFIDFVKGFMATEGTMFERIMGGLEEAVIGFVEMPIRLLGWVGEKILGLFGVESEGIADQAIANIRTSFDWLTKAIPNLIGGIWDLVKGMWNGMIDKAQSLVNKIPFVDADLTGLKFEEGPGVTVDGGLKSVSPVDTGVGTVAAQASAQNEQIQSNRGTTAALQRTNTAINRNTETNKQVIQNMSAIQVDANTKDDEIPSEPENMGVLLMNKSWGLS